MLQEWFLHLPGKIVIAGVANHARRQYVRPVPERLRYNVLSTGRGAGITFAKYTSRMGSPFSSRLPVRIPVPLIAQQLLQFRLDGGGPNLVALLAGMQRIPH